MRGRWALAAVAWTAATARGDALHGKRLYLDAARITGSGVSCVDCHGGLPGGLYGIGRAANDPARVAYAVDSIPQMTPLRGRLTGEDYADLAAYIGDPAVPSPQVALTTRLPGGGAGLDDRIEFGEVAVGAPETALLEVRNAGQLAFTLTGAPALVGADADAFAIASADCAAGSVVVPAAACRFELAFQPTGAGAKAAGFRVAHDWIHGAAAIALLGSATLAAEPPPPAPGCSSGGGGSGVALVALGVLVGRRRRAGSSAARPRPGNCTL